MSQGFARHGMTRESQLSNGWVRPSDWLALPTVTESDEKLVGLYKINNGNNWFAVTCSGAYTVDWGDGTTTDTAAGVTTYKNLAWSDYSSDTLTSEGFRQAIITITPQEANNLTSINIFVKHNQSGLANGYSLGWLDVTCCAPYVNSLGISYNSSTVRQSNLKRWTQIGTTSLSGNALDYMFYNCYGLVELAGSTTWVSNCTSGFRMFTNCYALTYVPDLDTSSWTNMGEIFSGCTSLKEAPNFDTSNVTNFNSAFNACGSLSEAPAWDYSLGTTASYMFFNCVSMTSAANFDMPNSVEYYQCFCNCYSLKELNEDMDTSSGTNFYAMFQSCYSLRSIPAIDTSSGTNFYGMFRYSSGLQSVPSLDTSGGGDMREMFNGCSTLSSISIDLTNAYNLGNIFNNCFSLRSLTVESVSVSFSVASCQLDSTALDALYGELATVSGQTITVTGNYGTTGDTPSIATGKGWTVTGS